MKITPKIKFVSGSFDTKESSLVLVPSDNHGEILLCVKESGCGWNIPIGEIKLYSSGLYVDFKETHKGSFEGWHPFKYVAIELMTYGKEIPDVWATNGAGTAIVEVKTSRADFLRDAAKHCRQNPIDGIGNFRWYYALQGIIKEEELPADWGLAEADENGKMIKLVRTAAY